jgi:hypothetical protein
VYFLTASAAFVLDAGPNPPLSHALVRAGFADARPFPQEDLPGLGISDASVEAATAQWPVAGLVWARMDRVHERPLLETYFARSVFIDAGPAAGDAARDELVPLGAAFSDACAQLPAEVAWLDTAAYYGDEDWVDRHGSGARNRQLAELVISGSIDALAGERLTLLWLNDDMADLLTVDVDDRDTLPTPKGLLLFGHNDHRRWL